MTVLSAQSIRARCVEVIGTSFLTRDGGRPIYKSLDKPLIEPFVEHGIVRGRSFGLSACTYDCRIADGLVLPVGQSRLASTIERFYIPADLCGSVLDKSTWARVFVTAFNTHLDPGWEGYLTVELSNLGTEV